MQLDEVGNPDVARASYTPITEANQVTVKHIKLLANEFLNEYLCVDSFSDSESKRLAALARTHIEIAAMFAVKAYTSEGMNK